jgi:hypothetical protein
VTVGFMNPLHQTVAPATQYFLHIELEQEFDGKYIDVLHSCQVTMF